MSNQYYDYGSQNQRPRKFRFPKIKFKKPSWKTVRAWIIWIVALGVAGIAVLFIIVSRDLPDPNRLLDRTVPESTKIYARDGTTLLYEVHGEVKRTLIPFDQMNNNVKDATISIEDRNFYNEGGIDIRGILRSVYVDITHGSLDQGASTITQQFVRNAILTREKTFSRKIEEIILSLEINERYSKDDILKLYLNEIPYGRNAYGIEAAAQAYFGIHAADLDLAQAAYLAALPQAPSFYNPTGPNRSSLDARKNQVLADMNQQGYISKTQETQAEAEVVKFLPAGDQIVAPHFVMYIENYVTEKYGEDALQNGGLNIVTTLDPRLQTIAENVITATAPKNEKSYNAYNEALVSIDPKTGQILAMVGSKNFFGDPEPAGCNPGVNCRFDPAVNVALAQRQPGSSAKPYVYVTAFDPKFKQSPATLRTDIITDFGTYAGKDYIPHNYLGNENGPVSIRQALAGSLNIPAVKTLDLVGVDNAVQTMHNFGITSPLSNCGLSLVLGGCEVTLLDHTAGYGTLATEGIHHATTGILKIEDSSGNILEQYQDQSSQVMDPQAAYEVINVMSDNSARTFVFGAKSPLYLADRPAAAKTGTTQNFHDGWTLGFTPSLVTGVWAGNNDGTLLKQGADGVVVAAPIWHDFMEQALAGTPPEAFTEPDGIQHVTVDALSGLLPTQYTPSTKTEVFANYSVPTTYDNVHVIANVPDPSNPGQTTTEACIMLHSEIPDNPAWENPVLAWDAAHTAQGYCPPGSTVISGAPGEQGNGIGTPPATDSSSTGSNTGNTTVPTNPPTVSITTPADGSTVATPFILQAQAQADQGSSIVRADLLIDGTIVQSLNNTPWNFNIPQLAPGIHVFAVHVVDNNNNSTDTSITLTTQ